MTKDEVIAHMLKRLGEKHPHLLKNGSLVPFITEECTAHWGGVIDTMEEFGLEINVIPKMYRSGGDCVCKTCGEEYWRHPPHARPYVLAAEDITIFRRLCNGDLVKL